MPAVGLPCREDGIASSVETEKQEGKLIRSKSAGKSTKNCKFSLENNISF